MPKIVMTTRKVRGRGALGWGCVVSRSRRPESARVGKNLPAKREEDPQGGRASVLERNVREETRKVRGRGVFRNVCA